MNDIKLIGIAGADQCGKSTLAKMFQNNGYFSAEISPILMEAGKPLGWNGTKDESPNGRMFLIRLGMALKQEFGGAFLIERAVDEAINKGHTCIVVPSIRTLEESAWIHDHNGIMIKIRRPEEEHKTILLYLGYLRQMNAQFEIMNDSTLEVFESNCEEVIRKLECYE